MIELEQGENILKKVTDKYLESADFNGLSVERNDDNLYLDNIIVREEDLITLIRKDKISLVFS